jgi:hypothetical protein
MMRYGGERKDEVRRYGGERCGSLALERSTLYAYSVRREMQGL